MSSPIQIERDALDAATILLFDGAALHDHERAMLLHAGAVHALYDDMNDPQARDAGPLWAWRTSQADSVRTALWDDPQRVWSVALLHVDSSIQSSEIESRMARHFRLLRYVHTHDGQRYFFRFADSRCLQAMHAVLNAAQRSRLFGPVQRWVFAQRDGQLHALLPDASPAPAVPSLHLHAKQLSALIDLTWPDQLIASALEARPDLDSKTTPAHRHEIGAQLCSVLRREGIERYPVQLASLMVVLDAHDGRSTEPQPVLTNASFIAALKRAEVDGNEQHVLRWADQSSMLLAATLPGSHT